MPTISIHSITNENWLDALDLAVQPHQRSFVPSVELSLAKAYIRPNGFHYDPFGLCLQRSRSATLDRVWQQQELIGFYSLIHLPEDPSFAYIGGFLIDYRFQGKGYGRAALLAIIDKLHTGQPRCNALLLSVHPDNDVAIKLYRTVGFEETGQWLDGEMVMKLLLSTE